MPNQRTNKVTSQRIASHIEDNATNESERILPDGEGNSQKQQLLP
jgi:hypothetical protein